jgi:hypothetical protein
VLCCFAPISDTKQTAWFRIYDTHCMLPVIAMDVYCKVPAIATAFSNAAAVSAAIAVAEDVYCKVPTIATAFDNTTAISAAIIAAVTIAWALLLPLPLPSCGGLLHNACHRHRICQLRCHQCSYCSSCRHLCGCRRRHCLCHCCVVVATVALPSPLCNILLR